MVTLRHIYEQAPDKPSDVDLEVRSISDRLLEHLNTPDALSLMVRANLPGMSSAEVQSSFGPFAAQLGFTSEAKGLFSEYQNKALRPDYFMRVGASGILLEVERGKTTTNNMDLLDVWKCHLCTSADYLFLMVPQALRHNPTMTPKKEFASVVKRLSSFFIRPENALNIRSLHIFGY